MAQCLDNLKHINRAFCPTALNACSQHTKHGRPHHCIAVEMSKNLTSIRFLLKNNNHTQSYLQWTMIGPELFLFCSKIDAVMAPTMALGFAVVPSAFQLNTWSWATRCAWPDCDRIRAGKGRHIRKSHTTYLWVGHTEYPLEVAFIHTLIHHANWKLSILLHPRLWPIPVADLLY